MRSTPWRILLIDDDEDDYILTVDMLYQVRKEKFTIEQKKTYRDGLQAVLAYPYDAVLCDYDLGKETGIDLIKEAVKRGCQAPIILLTGRGGYDVDVEAMQAGAVDYLDKSLVTPILLERAIRYAIDRWQASQALLQANEELLRERTRLRTVIDNAPSAIVFTDQAGKFVITNPAAQKIFGGNLTGDASGPAGGYTLHHLDGSPFLSDELPLQRALNDRQSASDMEMLVQHEGGKQVLLLSNSSPICDPDGSVAGAVAVMQDITRLKLTEQALREREMHFRSLADAMPQLVWTAEPDGTVDYYNQRWKEYQGIFPLEEGGWQWSLVVHPNDLDTTMVAWQQAIASGEVYQAEHRIHLSDGSFRWHLSRGIPAKDEAGRVVKWYGTATDIHEQKQVELELRQNQAEIVRTRNALLESQERFRLAIRNAPIFVFHSGVDLRYTWAYNCFLSRSPEELIGRTDEELFDLAGVAALAQAKREAIRTQSRQRIEIAFALDDRQLIYDFSIEPLLAPSGALIGLTGAAVDITDLRQLEARELEQKAQIEVQHRLIQQREMERLQIARDIHDGPIQELVSAAMLLPEATGSEDVQARAEQARLLHQALHKGIDDLRHFCHELRPPTLAPFGLEKAIRSHIGTFRERNPETQVHLELVRDGQTLPEEMRMALFRVYQELVNNIHKHAQASQIEIELAIEPDTVVLGVRDNGAGFVVTDDWLALARDGHLGLIGIRERVEAIGGQLRVVSQPQRGTSVTVSVPLDGNSAGGASA